MHEYGHEGGGWAVSARGSADPNQLTALNQLQPVPGVRKVPSWLPDCLLDKAGTLLNIWLYFHHGTRVSEC
jgi:hypothetical protein